MDEIPSMRELRWPVLVVLDHGTEEDPILELPERVARHLDLAPEVVDELDPETGLSVLTRRLLQAVADLYQVDAVDGSEDASRLWITDVGRRLSEIDARELPDADQEIWSDPAAPSESRDSAGDRIWALLELFSPI